MAYTTNPTISPAWATVVAIGDDFLLTLPATREEVEIATTANDSTPPAVVGHLINGGRWEGINRTLTGPGAVWARTQGGSVVAALTTFTP